MSCAKQDKNRNNGAKFDPFDLKVVYKFYLEYYKKFRTVDIWDRVGNCFAIFVNSDSYREINQEFNETYKHFVDQGTSNITNVIKAEKIFEQSKEFKTLFEFKLYDFLESNNVPTEMKDNLLAAARIAK